jgi:hypothetical protein
MAEMGSKPAGEKTLPEIPLFFRFPTAKAPEVDRSQEAG